MSEHLTLRDIIDSQPGGGGGDRRKKGSWFGENWMPLAMFVCWALTQLWSGTDWLHTRQSDEVATKVDVERLRQELQAVPATYVRQDVFTQVLIDINRRLASIDSKIER